MSIKCDFCGGEKDEKGPHDLCYFCYSCVAYSCVAYSMHKAYGPVSSRVKEEAIVTFWDSVHKYNLFNHPNKDLAWGRVSKMETIPEGPSLGYVKDLEKKRHELEAKVVELTNENFKLKDDLKKATVADAKSWTGLTTSEKPNKDLREAGGVAVRSGYYAENCCGLWDGLLEANKEYWRQAFDDAYSLIGKKNAELEKQLAGYNMIKEGLARCQLDNDRLKNEIKDLNNFLSKAEEGASVYMKQEKDKIEACKEQRNEWEKLAGQYRFKAEKLEEENKALEAEIEDLNKENDELCEENEDLDGEAEQYFQESRRLREANFRLLNPTYYNYLPLSFGSKHWFYTFK